MTQLYTLTLTPASRPALPESG